MVAVDGDRTFISYDAKSEESVYRFNRAVWETVANATPPTRIVVGMEALWGEKKIVKVLDSLYATKFAREKRLCTVHGHGEVFIDRSRDNDVIMYCTTHDISIRSILTTISDVIILPTTGSVLSGRKTEKKVSLAEEFGLLFDMKKHSLYKKLPPKDIIGICTLSEQEASMCANLRDGLVKAAADISEFAVAGKKLETLHPMAHILAVFLPNEKIWPSAHTGRIEELTELTRCPEPPYTTQEVTAVVPAFITGGTCKFDPNIGTLIKLLMEQRIADRAIVKPPKPLTLNGVSDPKPTIDAPQAPPSKPAAPPSKPAVPLSKPPAPPCEPAAPPSKPPAPPSVTSSPPSVTAAPPAVSSDVPEGPPIMEITQMSQRILRVLRTYSNLDHERSRFRDDAQKVFERLQKCCLATCDLLDELQRTGRIRSEGEKDDTTTMSSAESSQPFSPPMIPSKPLKALPQANQFFLNDPLYATQNGTQRALNGTQVPSTTACLKYYDSPPADRRRRRAVPSPPLVAASRWALPLPSKKPESDPAN